MMASLRWPSATPLSASTQTAPASGPRCRTVSIMASPIERSASAGVAARQSIMPAMPHIALPRTAVVVSSWRHYGFFTQALIGCLIEDRCLHHALRFWHAADRARSHLMARLYLTPRDYDQVTCKCPKWSGVGKPRLVGHREPR